MSMVIKQKAIELMKEYFNNEERFVNHAMQVTAFAEAIVQGEGIEHSFLQQVVTLAGIFHDVGIPAALAKHGTGAGPFQEREGEPIARELMTKLAIRPDILERVCFIVAHHHTREAVDGPDFQVIWEADALVNIPASWGKRDFGQTLPELIELNFQTKTGKELINKWTQDHNLH